MFSKEELNRFYQYCVALTGDETKAYDLLHESLEKFLRKERHIRSSKSYLMAVIRNCSIDQYRQASKNEIIELDENIIPANERDLESMVVNRDEVRWVLNFLNEDDRELLYLWAVEEYTARELARLLKIPRGTILSRLHRLKIKINNFLEEGNEKKSKRRHPRTLPKV